jgi:hypothetical protein
MSSGLIAPLLGLLYQIGQRGDSASTTGGALARLAWLVNKQDAFKDKTPYIAKNTSTIRESWVDVVNISGSGYLTSVAAGARDADRVHIGFRIVIDGVEKFISDINSGAEGMVFEMTFIPDHSRFSDSGLRLPALNMRFKTSLQVQRYAECESSISDICVIAVYQLD